jgi:hypothetical protein
MDVKTLKTYSVPEEKNYLFTMPAFKTWPSLLQKNKAALSAIKNMETSRTELVNIAAEYTKMLGFLIPDLKTNSNIIVTGHQPNWHHCGIFAKDIVADKFVKEIGGIAVELVLDHDICNTSMSVPTSGDNGIKIETVPLEKKRQDIPLEFRLAPRQDQITKFINTVSAACENSFCSDIWKANLFKIIDDSWYCRNIADTITQLQATLSRILGLEILYLPVSLMSQCDSFTDFVSSVISDSRRFVRIYNRAIKNKRQSANLKPNQTLRTLKIDYLNKIIELPFWLLWKTGKRASLYASLNDKDIRIGTSDTTIGTIDSSGNKNQQLWQILRKNDCGIRPKAVTLTLFTRLYLADLFIHGAGAVNYEYITDSLIRDFYKKPDVNFGIATATMALPQDNDYREFFFGLFPQDTLKKLIGSKRGRI